MTKEDIYTFLKEKHVAMLATVGPKHMPHLSLMYFLVDPDLNIYFLTKDKTKKYLNTKKNKHVAVNICDHTAFQTVEIKGPVSLVKNQTKKNMLWEEFTTKVSGVDIGYPPICKLECGNAIFLKLTPEWIRYADFKKRKKDDSSYFTQIF